VPLGKKLPWQASQVEIQLLPAMLAKVMNIIKLSVHINQLKTRNLGLTMIGRCRFALSGRQDLSGKAMD
jgi:hypothetical protein